MQGFNIIFQNLKAFRFNYISLNQSTGDITTATGTRQQ